METKRTEIGQLGEFGLIERLSGGFHVKNTSTIRGAGDDAAVIDAGADYMLLSTDMLVEGIHFDLAYAPLQHVGYKAVAVNVSDIAAMNGRPEQVVVSIAVSNRFSVEAIEELYEGMRLACENYGVDLVGGDTTSSLSGMILSVSVVGRVSKDQVVYRDGAKANDIICVSGDLGAGYLGLQILEREKEVYLADQNMQPQLEQYEHLVRKTLRPEARTDIIYELAEQKVKPSAMIDISDGLSSELFHIAKQSKVGVRIFEDKIPIDQTTFQTAVQFHLDPITCALNGGDEYELLFTIHPENFERIKMHPDIHFIGYVHDNASENVLITKMGNVVPLKAQGWSHFNLPGKE